MDANEELVSDIAILLGQMRAMSENYVKSESNDCRYVAFYMGKFADRWEMIVQRKNALEKAELDDLKAIVEHLGNELDRYMEGKDEQRDC